MLRGSSHGGGYVRFRCNVIGGYLLGGLSQQPGLLVVYLHGFLQSVHGSEVSASFTPFKFTLAKIRMHLVSPVRCQRDVVQSRYRSELFLLRLGRNFWRTCTVSPGSRAAIVPCRDQTGSLRARRQYRRRVDPANVVIAGYSDRLALQLLGLGPDMLSRGVALSPRARLCLGLSRAEGTHHRIVVVGDMGSDATVADGSGLVRHRPRGVASGCAAKWAKRESWLWAFSSWGPRKFKMEAGAQFYLLSQRGVVSLSLSLSHPIVCAFLAAMLIARCAMSSRLLFMSWSSLT